MARLTHYALLLAVVVGLLSACGNDPPAPFVPTAKAMAAHNAALGLMGKYEFEAAVPAFDAVLRDAPGWRDARVNLSIALLNTQDEAALNRAQAELARVLTEEPGHLRAATTAGLIFLYRGFADRALPLFEMVAKADPDDAYAMSWVGSALRALDRNAEAVTWFTKAFTRDPYLQSAYYEAFQALQALDRAGEGDALFEAYERLSKNPLARLAQFKYSRMGPKAMATVGGARPTSAIPPLPEGAFFAEKPGALALSAANVTWAQEPGPVSSVDFDGDGRLDLFLVGGRATPDGPRGLLLQGTDAGFSALIDHPLCQVADVRAALWGDLDNDGRVDAYLCRRGENRLFLQRAGGVFEDVTALAQAGGGPWDTVDGLLADLDHDGDLDIYLVNGDERNELLSNNLDGTFRSLGASSGVAGDGSPSTGAIAADLDGDRDLDLVVFHQASTELFWNDRLWAWRAAPDVVTQLSRFGALPSAGVAADADGDGLPELYTRQVGGMSRWSLARDGRYVRTGTWEPAGALEHPSGVGSLAIADLDGDGRLDLLTGGRGWVLAHNIESAERLAVSAGDRGHAQLWRDASGTAGTPWLLAADPARGPVVLRTRPGAAPELLLPASHAYRFAGLRFSGKHKEADSMRSNASGLGVRATVQVGARGSVYHQLRNQSGPGQSLQPLFVGLGPAPALDFVTLDWPDGLLQTEAGLEAGKTHVIEEVQRQTSSCPVLFCWDGAKYRFVTDLLGVGGIGFWVAPDTYAPPMPREHLLLPEGLPVARDGRYVLKLGEPMEETCYLDHADLVAWDLPRGWQMVLDERMGVLGPMPTSEPRFFRRERAPSRAFAGGGADVTAAIREADLKAAPVGPLDTRFVGRTQGSVLTLEFDEPIETGPGAPLLVADGWIEYPYAQTLFAAWQANAEYKAPTLEARGRDGAWRVVQEQFGYPAGMPRRMSFPLAGLPAGTTALRLSTTYEIYWDRIAVAYAEPCPEARRTVLPRSKAALLSSGFARRTTGPQRVPHYDWEKRVPLWDCRHQQGLYTRLGDVEALVATTDDALCVFGPGEEVHLEYDAHLAPPPAGCVRRFVLETTGWCKDSDLMTKDGDTVGPLPVREGVSDNRARDALHKATLTRLGPPR